MLHVSHPTARESQTLVGLNELAVTLYLARNLKQKETNNLRLQLSSDSLHFKYEITLQLMFQWLEILSHMASYMLTSSILVAKKNVHLNSKTIKKK